MKAERQSPTPPRCEVCGRFMSLLASKERLKVYECCGHQRARFRPQFQQPAERLYR